MLNSFIHASIFPLTPLHTSPLPRSLPIKHAFSSAKMKLNSIIQQPQTASFKMDSCTRSTLGRESWLCLRPATQSIFIIVFCMAHGKFASHEKTKRLEIISGEKQPCIVQSSLDKVIYCYSQGNCNASSLHYGVGFAIFVRCSLNKLFVEKEKRENCWFFPYGGIFSLASLKLTGRQKIENTRILRQELEKYQCSS